MRKFLLFFGIILSTLNISAQQKDTPLSGIYSNVLQQGELMIFGNKGIKFKEVLSDSRCPAKVTCIWAGEATILLEIFENGNFLRETEYTLNGGNNSLDFSEENILYHLSGMTLTPYPTVEAKNKAVIPNYHLQIMVTEKYL
ncbi:hypothetical protein BH23BAC2_BH23BAC2_16510 [soil metagenome]